MSDQLVLVRRVRACQLALAGSLPLLVGIRAADLSAGSPADQAPLVVAALGLALVVERLTRRHPAQPASAAAADATRSRNRSGENPRAWATTAAGS